MIKIIKVPSLKSRKIASLESQLKEAWDIISAGKAENKRLLSLLRASERLDRGKWYPDTDSVTEDKVKESNND